MTVKFSQERKVRSFAKKTFGSMRVGRAIRLPVGMRMVVSPLKRACGRGRGWQIGLV